MSAKGLAHRESTNAQIPRKFTLRWARSALEEDPYRARMASSAMLPYLAAVARQAREAKGRKPYNIASAEPGMRGADPSTVWRFEHAEGWPQSADHMIDLYAADLGIEPIELWARALELWREEEGGVTVAAAEGPPHAGVGGLADRLLGEADSPQSEESDSEQSGPAG